MPELQFLQDLREGVYEGAVGGVLPLRAPELHPVGLDSDAEPLGRHDVPLLHPETLLRSLGLGLREDVLHVLGDLDDAQPVLVGAEHEHEVPLVPVVLLHVAPAVLRRGLDELRLVASQLGLGYEGLHEAERTVLLAGSDLEVLAVLEPLHDLGGAAESRGDRNRVEHAHAPLRQRVQPDRRRLRTPLTLDSDLHALGNLVESLGRLRELFIPSVLVVLDRDLVVRRSDQCCHHGVGRTELSCCRLPCLRYRGARHGHLSLHLS